MNKDVANYQKPFKRQSKHSTFHFFLNKDKNSLWVLFDFPTLQ